MFIEARAIYPIFTDGHVELIMKDFLKSAVDSGLIVEGTLLTHGPTGVHGLSSVSFTFLAEAPDPVILSNSELLEYTKGIGDKIVCDTDVEIEFVQYKIGV